MIAKIFRKVSRHEFDEYNASFGVDLVHDINPCCDPTVLTVNDFSNGMVWPESVVSYSILGDDNFDQSSYYIL